MLNFTLNAQRLFVFFLQPLFDICRAMLCIAQLYYSNSVRQSVRPSVIRQYSVETAKHYHQTFSLSGSPNILVFPYQTGWQYSYGDPDNGYVECSGVWKKRDFQPISRVISEMIQHRAIVTMESEKETVPKLSNCTIFDDLEWPLTENVSSWYYSTSSNLKMVQSRTILTMASNWKSYRTAAFSVTLNDS